MLNIVCTSKPCDGLFYYSYEYTQYLNHIGVKTDMIIVTHPRFTTEDYFNAIIQKYNSFENVIFDDFEEIGQTLIMGRSMMTLPYLDRELYSMDQLLLLHLLFKYRVTAVYSENHPVEYYDALNYFAPAFITDLCDYDVFPKGEGAHFEKKIYFDIHKPIERDPKFKYLFNGTNKTYYAAAKKVISKYKDHGIMIYDIGNYDSRMNNLIVPVENIMGIFDKYVYTKNINDPAPRIIQECLYHNKEIIFEATNKGAEVYMNRKIEKPNVEAIINAV